MFLAISNLIASPYLLLFRRGTHNLSQVLQRRGVAPSFSVHGAGLLNLKGIDHLHILTLDSCYDVSFTSVA